MEHLDQLNDCQLFTWNCVAWKSFINTSATFREKDRNFYSNMTGTENFGMLSLKSYLRPIFLSIQDN